MATISFRPQFVNMETNMASLHQQFIVSIDTDICNLMTSSDGNFFCEFPAQRPVPRNFDVFFDLPLDKRLSNKSRGWWFETPRRPL